MSRLCRAALAALSLAATLGLPTTAHAVQPTRVAIIVGPAGSLTPTYLANAELAAATAEAHGAVVARAYSPSATPANVLAAVEGANVVIYFGHGYGHPSPYGGLDTSRQNGWALQGPLARGTHEDGLDGYVAYYGEDWIVANARPAPGFVMIYSNTCYAPGASEGGFPPATPWEAAMRVAFYSRSIFALGGSAYYATDFDGGAAGLVGRLLADRTVTYGAAFAWDPSFVPSGLAAQAHPFSPGQVVWTHRSIYAEGPPNYWYAFAGNPDLAPLQAWDATAPTATLGIPAANGTDVAPDAALEVRLSEAVTGISAQSVTLRDDAGSPVAVGVSFDEAELTATVKPERPLTLSRSYVLSIGEGVTDVAGRALAPVSWQFTTRIDADPLVTGLSVVLEAGTHVLTRFADDGVVTDTRTLDVVDRRWVLADRRARMPGQAGSWLRLDDPTLDEWWVPESASAHALGQSEEVLLPDRTVVTLSRTSHPVIGLAMPGSQPGDSIAPATEAEVTVDRRRVVDGRTYLRLATTRSAGSWIEAPPGVGSTEAVAQRILARESRDGDAEVILGSGEQLAFRFDSDGRVVDRRTVRADVDERMRTHETIVVNEAHFIVIADGALAGWAVLQTDEVRILEAWSGSAGRE